MNRTVGVAALALVGLALFARGGAPAPVASGGVQPKPPPPIPERPPSPPGWKPLSAGMGELPLELRIELGAKASAVLASSAPMGSLTPFTASNGELFGAFVTRHEKGGTIVRAVEIWMPA